MRALLVVFACLFTISCVPSGKYEKALKRIEYLENKILDSTKNLGVLESENSELKSRISLINEAASDIKSGHIDIALEKIRQMEKIYILSSNNEIILFTEEIRRLAEATKAIQNLKREYGIAAFPSLQNETMYLLSVLFHTLSIIALSFSVIRLTAQIHAPTQRVVLSILGGSIFSAVVGIGFYGSGNFDPLVTNTIASVLLSLITETAQWIGSDIIMEILRSLFVGVVLTHFVVSTLHDETSQRRIKIIILIIFAQIGLIVESMIINLLVLRDVIQITGVAVFIITGLTVFIFHPKSEWLRV